LGRLAILSEPKDLCIPAGSGRSARVLSGKQSYSGWRYRLRRYSFIFGREQVSTIFFGSIASLSTCSSMIFPSLPTRKFTRRGA
jgi:hypothetical protein